MTSKKLTGKDYQNQTFGPLGAHAKTSVLRGSKRAYKEAEAPCSLKSCECLTKDKKLRNSFHPISSWKTLKHCYQVAKGGTLQQSSLKWQKEGIIINSAQVVPQNRERVYIIGHLGDRRTAQVFPIRRQGKNLVRTNSKIEVVGNTSPTGHRSQNVISSNGISPTLTATDYKHPKQVAIKQVGNYMVNSRRKNPEAGRIYDPMGLSPTLNTMQGGNRQPKIIVRACITPGRIIKRQNGRRFKNQDEPSFTLSCQDRHGVLLKKGNNVQIRKLTPLECWRLQGFSDEQFKKAREAGISDSQLYKQAGNAVTVPVIREIGKKLKLFDAREDF